MLAHGTERAPRTLTVPLGCLSAFIETDGPAKVRWTLRTDVVVLAGRQFPGREISLMDENGALAWSDSPNAYQINVFPLRSQPLSATQTVALAILRSFVDIDGHPPECITPS